MASSELKWRLEVYREVVRDFKFSGSVVEGGYDGIVTENSRSSL